MPLSGMAPCKLWTDVSGTTDIGALATRNAATDDYWLVAGEYNGETAISTDGTNWTVGGSGWGGAPRAINWTGSKFLMVTGNYTTWRTYTSSDGLSWTHESSMPTTYTFQGSSGSTYGHGLHIVGAQTALYGFFATAVSGDDGATWTMRLPRGATVGSTSGFVTTQNGFLMFTAQYLSWSPTIVFPVLYSTDGVSWYDRYINIQLTSWYGVAAIGNRIVALGFDTTAYVSTNEGSTWTSVTMPSISGSAMPYWRTVRVIGDKFMALSSLGYYSLSSNGLSWSRPCPLPDFADHWSVIPKGMQALALGTYLTAAHIADFA